MSNTPLEQVMEIEKAILLYFAEDALSGLMYAAMPQFEKKELRKLFIAMKHLRYVVRTNPRPGRAATFCISQKGRELLRTQYGIELKEPV